VLTGKLGVIHRLTRMSVPSVRPQPVALPETSFHPSDVDRTTRVTSSRTHTKREIQLSAFHKSNGRFGQSATTSVKLIFFGEHQSNASHTCHQHGLRVIRDNWIDVRAICRGMNEFTVRLRGACWGTSTVKSRCR
jgi:hypothetical protein